MRPIAGVVTNTNKTTTTIQLETGMNIVAKIRKDLKIGAKCWVSYDHSRGKVLYLFKDDPTLRLRQDTTEPMKTKCQNGENSDLTESSSDSGALSLCSDGWEFWDSNSGVLGLS